MTSRATKIAVIGNCQSRPIGECLTMMLPDNEIEVAFSGDIRIGRVNLDTMVQTNDILVVQTAILKHVQAALDRFPRVNPEIVLAPTLFFSGYQPDIVYVKYGDTLLKNPSGNSNSAIVVYGWMKGLSVDDIVGLFNGRVYQELNYMDYLEVANRQLLAEANSIDINLTEELEYWKKSGCFMYTANHPKLMVLAGIARGIVNRLSKKASIHFPEQFLFDRLSANFIWPVYSEIAEYHGLRSDNVFKMPQGGRFASQAPVTMTIDEFVRASFESYRDLDPRLVNCARFEDPSYEKMLNHVGRAGNKKSSRSRNPYAGLPPHHFWSKAVAAPKFDVLDPVVDPKFKIKKSTKIATAGSCFAQHIAQSLQKSGFKYYIAEDGTHLTADEAKARQFGVYSARYGNIYTTTQLAQLIDRVNGKVNSADNAWKRLDGRFIDPFRPQIEQNGFETIYELENDRLTHFKAVQQLFKELDIFIFTLGLTESWRSKADKMAFPVAPGVISGDTDLGLYEFHNYSVEETVESMRHFIVELRKLNPTCKIILTVSPVPLVATYENRHVLVSTTYSKSVLRVAADVLARTLHDVEYFPSYEIIAGSYNRGQYFESDLRSVTAKGVAHVMNCFLARYTISDQEDAKNFPDVLPHSYQSTADEIRNKELIEGQKIICDEEILDDNRN